MNNTYNNYYSLIIRWKNGVNIYNSILYIVNGIAFGTVKKENETKSTKRSDCSYETTDKK